MANQDTIDPQESNPLAFVPIVVWKFMVVLVTFLLFVGTLAILYWLKKEQNKVIPLTPEQVAQVRKVAYESARRLNLSDDRASLLADAIKGSIFGKYDPPPGEPPDIPLPPKPKPKPKP